MNACSSQKPRRTRVRVHTHNAAGCVCTLAPCACCGACAVQPRPRAPGSSQFRPRPEFRGTSPPTPNPHPPSPPPAVVHLTKVKTHRREQKAGLVTSVRAAVGAYTHAYVVSFANMRTQKLKNLRGELAEDSRFFLGKNRVMARALSGDAAGEEEEGEEEEEGDADEDLEGGASATAPAPSPPAAAKPARSSGAPYRPGLDKLAADLRGNVGLLFSSRAMPKLAAALGAGAEADYARSGATASATVTVPAGPLDLPHTMVDELRRAGMAGVRLVKGVPVLGEPHTIAEEGDVLTPEQARLLKHFGHKQALFQVTLLSKWTAKSGKYERLVAATD